MSLHVETRRFSRTLTDGMGASVASTRAIDN